jgi:hypothetical protein
MTTNQLSPAAQAVLDAANGKSSYGPDDCLNESRWIAAAALRAVAEHCVPDDSEGHWVYIPHVLAIANELEGAS